MDTLKGLANKATGGEKSHTTGATGGNTGAGQDYGDKGTSSHSLTFKFAIVIPISDSVQQVSLPPRRSLATRNPLRPTSVSRTLAEAPSRRLLGTLIFLLY